MATTAGEVQLKSYSIYEGTDLPLPAVPVVCSMNDRNEAATRNKSTERLVWPSNYLNLCDGF